MSRDGSVAPKERINIRYVPATGDAQEDVELPLRMLVVGDFTRYLFLSHFENSPSLYTIQTSFQCCPLGTETNERETGEEEEDRGEERKIEVRRRGRGRQRRGRGRQ